MSDIKETDIIYYSTQKLHFQREYTETVVKSNNLFSLTSMEGHGLMVIISIMHSFTDISQLQTSLSFLSISVMAPNINILAHSKTSKPQ